MVSLYNSDFKFYDIDKNELNIFSKNSTLIRENKEEKIIVNINVKLFNYMLPLFYGNKIDKKILNIFKYSEIENIVNVFGLNKLILVKIGSILNIEELYYNLDIFDQKIREEENINRNKLIEGNYSNEYLSTLDKQIEYNNSVLELIKNSENIKRNYYFTKYNNNFDEKLPVYEKIPEQINKILNTMKKGIISKLMECENIVIAGGSVMQYFSKKIQNTILDFVNEYEEIDVPFSDIDIFVIKIDNIQKNIENIINIITNYYNCNEIKIYDNNSAISIWIITDFYIFKFQIIKRIYVSVYQVLSGFDLDSSCVAIYMNKLYALPRFWRCLSINSNIIDNKRQSTSYMVRLKKYKKLYGINICIPIENKILINTDSNLFKLKSESKHSSDYSEDLIDTGFYYLPNKTRNMEEYIWYENLINKDKKTININEINYSEFRIINPGDQRYGVNNPTDNNLYEDFIKGYLF